MSLPVSVYKFFDNFFFVKKFAVVPLKDLSKKLKFVKTSFLWFGSLPFYVSLPLYVLRTFFYCLNDFLSELILFDKSLRGTTANFSLKKEVVKKIINTYRQAQFFMLIPNILLVLTQFVIFRTKIWQISVKNCVMCSTDICQIFMVYRPECDLDSLL